MANPYRGAVDLKVGDRLYTISFSVNAICELEEFFDGKPVGEIVAELGDGSQARMTTIRALIWAGLLDHHSDVDLKEAGKIASDIGVTPCMEAIGRALELAFPTAEAKAAPRPRKAKDA